MVRKRIKATHTHTRKTTAVFATQYIHSCFRLSLPSAANRFIIWFLFLFKWTTPTLLTNHHHRFGGVAAVAGIAAIDSVTFANKKPHFHIDRYAKAHTWTEKNKINKHFNGLIWDNKSGICWKNEMMIIISFYNSFTILAGEKFRQESKRNNVAVVCWNTHFRFDYLRLRLCVLCVVGCGCTYSTTIILLMVSEY